MMTSAVTTLVAILCASSVLGDFFPGARFGVRFNFDPTNPLDVLKGDAGFSFGTSNGHDTVDVLKGEGGFRLGPSTDHDAADVLKGEAGFSFGPSIDHDTIDADVRFDGQFRREPSHDFIEEVNEFLESLRTSTSDLFKKLVGAGNYQECAVRGPRLCRVWSRYRTIDGTCNNLLQPTLGAAHNTYSRLLPPRYSEHQQLAVSVTGKPLPPPRDISLVIFPEKKIDNKRWTLLTMQWGQTVSHDMSLTLVLKNKDCCTSDRSGLLSNANPTCYSIRPDHNDPFFGPPGVRCLTYRRTLRDSCSRHDTEQLTAVTAFLDASMLYGPRQAEADELRLFKSGLLRTEVVDHGRRFPPPLLGENRTIHCRGAKTHEACFLTGDERANQHPQLTSMQTVLLREHNRLASALAVLNPHWDDERLYQEARRILIAEFQHITYTQWLLSFIDYELARQYKLLPSSYGYGLDYDPTLDPRVLNEHATAAFRFFHTTIQGNIHLVNEHRETYGSLKISDHMGRPDIILRDGKFDDLLRGLTTQAEEDLDQFIDSEVTVRLFRLGREVGNDLVSIDIQRGRDHGLASYNDVRSYCGLRRASTWEDFLDFISTENVARLSKLYEHPDDVDLYVGGFLERFVRGATAGPTFLCILAEQFRRTRRGDRFFYNYKDNGLTPEQLREIRKATVARLLCDNSDDIKSIQPNAFERISRHNPLVPCESLPHVDLIYWKERLGEWHEHNHEPAYGPHLQDEWMQVDHGYDEVDGVVYGRPVRAPIYYKK